MRHTTYQQLQTIPMPVLEARKRLVRQLALKFERAGNERARYLSRQGINWGDMWHTDRITDREMQRLVRGYLRYFTEHELMTVELATLGHKVFLYTDEFHTTKSVAELEAIHLAKVSAELRAKRHSA